jgi:hypothetical protein
MRISEITDAQGQLELLRTVIDNTWTAIAQQAEQEKRAESERKAQANLKPRGKKASKAQYAPLPTPLKKPKPTLSKPEIPTANATKLNALAPIKPQAYSHTQSKNKLKSTALASTDTAQSPPTIASKYGYFGKNTDTIAKHSNGDGRHSKNGVATHKKMLRNFRASST